MNLLLNKVYYENLLEKYQSIKILPDIVKNKFCLLVIKMILNNLRNRNSIHINFQNEKTLILEVAKQLFIEAANEIFCNAADFPDPKIGDKLKARNKRFIKNSLFKYIGKRENNYILKFENDDTSEICVDEETFIKEFIQISQNVQDNTLKRFFNFFAKLNNKAVYFFNPTNFERKSVFIAPKTFYDSLEVKNKIPTTYFPNPREENTIHETKSIPALPDSIMYFAPRYKVCYENVLIKQKKVDTLVVFDTEEAEIEQIVQDKNRFGFNLIVLTNTTSPVKYSQVPCWNWYKEEIEMINSL